MQRLLGVLIVVGSVVPFILATFLLDLVLMMLTAPYVALKRRQCKSRGQHPDSWQVRTRWDKGQR
jgi:hypothetical protein